MSRSKEVVMILLDGGPSMAAPLRERALQGGRGAPNSAQSGSRFDAAVGAVEVMIQQKLFLKSKGEIGVVVYGSAETDNQLNEEQGQDEYRNVRVLEALDMPTLRLCDKLRELAPCEDSSVKVDILDGLIVALDLLFRRTENKKCERKLMVITDAAAKITDPTDIEAVVQMITSMEVKLQVIGLDFRTTSDTLKTENVDDAGEASADVKGEQAPADIKNFDKSENEKMLVSIAAEVGGHVSSVSKRIQLMAQGMKRSVNPTTKFRGNLEIGTDGFGIPVYCYLKTKPVTLPTLAKESQASYEKETAGRVRMDRRYMNPRDPDEEVPPDHQVRAYRYGKEKVPFSSADVEFFKFQTEKSLKVLGFLDRSLMSPTKFMEPTDMFIAEPGKPHAAEALAALIEAMVSMNQVAIARFVARKNAAPKVVVLIPNSPSNGEEKYYAFWSNVLPFEEDVRNYEFAPLKTRQFTPNAEQQALADKLVDSLSVRDDKADEVGSCFNPVAHRFFNAVSTRAFDDGAPIPPIPADIEASINMDPVRKQQIEPLIRGFGDAFSLREAVKVKSNRKKKAFWSDVSTSLSETVKQEAASKDDGDHDDNEDAADGGASDGELDLDDLLDGSSGVTTVGSMNPVADFEALIDVSSVKRHDRLERLKAAVGGMKTQIESFLGQRDGQFHRKGLQCLAHFRKRSVNIQYAVEFNEFLVALKGSLCEESDAWDAVKREGVTLLSSDDDPSVGVTPAHARAFLYGEEDEDADAAAAAAAASLSLQVETMEQEDDMFADFE